MFAWQAELPDSCSPSSVPDRDLNLKKGVWEIVSESAVIIYIDIVSKKLNKEAIMSTTAEISYAIQNDHPSFMIRVSAQGEGNSTPDLRGMLFQIQEAITDFQKTPQAKLLPSADVVVQDVPQFTSTAHTAQAKPFPANKGKEFSQKGTQQQKDNPEKDSPRSVTQKQIGLIRLNLKQRNIPEKVFCSSHDVARIEDLSLNQARSLIMNEDY